MAPSVDDRADGAGNTADWEATVTRSCSGRALNQCGRRSRSVSLVILFVAIAGCGEPSAPTGINKEPPLKRADFGFAVGVLDLHGPQLDSALSAAKSAGAEWIRFTIAPSVIEPRQGVMRWAQTDSIVEAIHRAGLKPLVLIFHIPRWNTTAPAELLRNPPPNRPGAFSLYPPADYELWAEQVRRIVERYRRRVPAWEVWNEPDMGTIANEGDPCPMYYWCGTASQYAKLLAITAAAIRNADAGATVVLGGLAMGGPANRDFLRMILADPEYPAAKYFDVANIHFYGESPSSALALIDTVRRTLVAGGAANRPIWITETGTPAAPNTQELVRQSNYVEQILPAFIEAGVECVLWYRLTDPQPLEGPGYGGPDFGLLRRDLTPKPAYYAFQAVTQVVTPATEKQPPGRPSKEGRFY